MIFGMKSRPMRQTLIRCLLVAAVAALLASCGSSRVYRDGSGTRARVSTPKYGATTTVKRGDTLYRIAVNNGISPLDLAMWNGIRAPYTIYPGQRLRLYPESGSRRTTPTTHASRPPSRPAPRPATTPARPPVAAPRPAPVPATSPVAWRWPADGELVIVKHDDEWLSAYGHNRARLVNEGQLVKAGQQIAEMGRTGAARDMLHFEIRHNGKPVDPLRYLPRK